jgi:diketogulonate reductase-like aldo/keto reductase
MASHILKLNNGDSFPALGFGTYSAVKGQAYKATLHALRSGFRHIDTAFGYDNEEEGKPVSLPNTPLLTPN